MHVMRFLPQPLAGFTPVLVWLAGRSLASCSCNQPGNDVLAEDLLESVVKNSFSERCLEYVIQLDPTHVPTPCLVI